MALACQVTPRTLERHFQEFLGLSPTRILHHIRLDHIRHELLLGRDSVTVRELATSATATSPDKRLAGQALPTSKAFNDQRANGWVAIRSRGVSGSGLLQL